jgi:hypothetical protein
MMTTKRIALWMTTVLVGLIAMASVSFADGPSAYAGTWVMNVAKSNFGSDPPMKTFTLTVTEPAAGSLKDVVDYTEANGTATHFEFTFSLDGTAAPVTGNPNTDSVHVKQIKPGTLHFRFTKAGKTVQWGTFRVSADGKRMHGRLGGKESDGSTWKYRWLLERQ